MFSPWPHQVEGVDGVIELERLEDDAAIELIDRRQGLVKLRYADFDWTLNDRVILRR